jgi:hypothetical protein
MDMLNVRGITNEGKFVRAFFSIGDDGTGTWKPWIEVNAAAGAKDPGPFSSMDSAGFDAFIHICGVTVDGRLLHTTLADNATQWGGFDDLQTIIGGDWGRFLEVRVDIVAGELHLCVLVHTPHGQQRILHTVRHNIGIWDAFQDITQDGLAGFPGSFVSVDCAAGTDSTQKLHVCGVTADGKLWHTALSNQNVWSQFAEVKSDLPKDTGHFTGAEADSSSHMGHFTDVRIAGVDDKIHICALHSGALLHTILFSNPVSWQPVFDNVFVEASNPGTVQSMDCSGEAGILHACVVTTDEKLWHTIWFERPEGWVPFDDVTAIIGDLSILLKIISLIASSVVLFDISSCPVWVGEQKKRDCYGIKHDPHHAHKYVADIQSLRNVQGCGNLPLSC